MRYIALIPIRLYQIFISPWLGGNCRYHPTCSCYTKDAIKQHGIIKGWYLGLRRILSCHPYSRRDIVDYVPQRFAWKDMLRYKIPSHEHEDDKDTIKEDK